LTAPVDRDGAARAIAAFLEALGYDPRSTEFAGTPERVVAAFADELLRGRDVDLGALLRDGSEPVKSDSGGLVIVRGVQAVTVCPHHLLPGLGSAIVAYLPGRRLLGLGAIARLVDACSRRPTLQEHIGERIVAALMEHAGARGAFCELELLHTCFATRGAEQPDGRLVTVARAGELARADALAELSLALGAQRTR
jgi:GTP cyclohydrolase IA